MLETPNSVLTLFLELCAVESPPGNERAVADRVAAELRGLGLEVEEDAIASAAGPGCRIYSHRSSTSEADWWFWSVTDDETALLISYARPVGHAGDVDAVNGLVRSVRLYHSAPVH